MIKMTKELMESNQNIINYLNADDMFNDLRLVIQKYGKEFILKEEHDTEVNCIMSYVARANVMRHASDAIEHYAKAILIQNGHTWDESKSWGHNLLVLFQNLDKESRSMIIVALSPLNIVDSSMYTNDYNEYDQAIMYLYNVMSKYHYIENPELINNNIKYDLDNKYSNVNINKIDYKMPYIYDENITGLKGNETVEGELGKLNPQNIPGQPKQQLFGIKSRFPGQYYVEGNTEFLISLAYALNGVSEIYRKRENNEKIV